MKIRPLYDRIVVKRIEQQEQLQGGLYIPDSAKEKPQEGEVVAVGKGKRLEDGKVVPLDVQVSDRILFGKYWGGYHLPRHLTFFGPSQIKRFLENHGFEEVKTTGCIQPSNWLLSFTNYLKATNSPLIQKGWFSPHNFLLLALSTPFAILLGFLGLCPIIRFSARKPE